MPKQKTVKIDIEFLEQKVAEQGWSNSYFCEKLMEKSRGWISEWKRGSSFPTPNNAARMCILLHTTPEEILQATGETEQETAKCQADIALVRSLMEQQGVKKTPAAKGEGSKETMLSFIRKTDDRAALLAIISEASKKLQEME